MTSKGKAKSHMTSAIIAAIIEEIRAHERGERQTRLSWAVLEKFSGFSKVAMWSKPSIKAAFQQAFQSRRADATPAIKPRRTADERVSALQHTVEDLRENLRAYDELWALYEYNVHRMGWDPDELRRPLDPLAREVVRHPKRLRAVR